MRFGRYGHIALPPFLTCLASLALCPPAAADDTSWDRHPRRANLAQNPAGVPADFVLTHNGFFHASCVVAVRADEVWGTDLVIRGTDGVEHDRIVPCAYPRYSLSGRAIAPAAATIDALQSIDVRHARDVYDGWVAFYDYAGTVTTGANLSTRWIVPLPPKNVGNQDIAFFNDIETNHLILQPVLDFSELPGQWAIESENCCASGNDVQSKLVAVSPGDVILGTIQTASCGTNGICANWTVTTTDLTTGKSTALNMQNPKEVANEVNPGALETYNVTSCDMFPANGEITFFDNMLTNASGGAEQVKYDLATILKPASYPSGFPANCGYGGTASGNSYTLFFGTSPTPVGDAGNAPGDDAGTVADGSTSGSGGSTSSGGSSSSGSGGGSSGTTSSGASSSSSSGSAGSTGGGSNGGSSGSTGGGSSSGTSGASTGGSASSSGASADAGTFDGDLSSSQSSGCACNTANANRESPALALGLGLLVLARRRVPSNRRLL